MKEREVFKQMILQGEDLVDYKPSSKIAIEKEEDERVYENAMRTYNQEHEFGDAPMDFFAREFKQLQQEKGHDEDEDSGDDNTGQD
jgi:hypothetical protein